MSIKLEEYVGKKVILVHHQNGPDAVEVEGTISVASAAGVMIKPKGKTNFEIIDLDAIDDIRLAPESTPAQRAAKRIKVKQVKEVTLGQARAHLLERHGWTLVKANGTTEEDAFLAHQAIDHVALDLGHVHTEEDAARAEEAVKAASVADANEYIAA